ncbi:uncharacterized protein LOC126858959 isoform X1 [Cataglyphis hispanica]|uniref:uncharacterized protein LOC126858959 isoform X1 n=1 Tax=Cataglyphis hispanica TaxID=1086592 RepID=UPI0021809A28|nr:uncharacterized protein LOC126858959 isoform X1 [Cataglyphis hispanica]
METSRKKNDTFYIKNNILIGQETLNLDEKNCINIGELILKSFESNSNFIGQVNAITKEVNTFEDMRGKSVKCALWMQKLGVQPNDVIMICTNNHLDAYVPFLAALYIGAIVSPLDQYFAEDNLSYFLEQVKPVMLFIDEKFYEIAYRSANQLNLLKNIPNPTIIAFHEIKNKDLLNKYNNLSTLEKIINDYYDIISVKHFSCAKVVNMKSTAMILFTSGTTAFPELVKIPHLAFMAPSDQQAPNMLKNDIALLFESLCFINGIFITIQAILLQVTIIRIKIQFDAEVACILIEKFKVTWAFLETSMCYHLINDKSYDRKKYDVSSLRTIVFTGSTIQSYKVHEELKAWLPKTSILQAYSLTETGIIAYQRESGKIESSGYVSADVQLKFISLNSPDQLLGPNMYGEICCISPYMMGGQELDDFSNSNKLLISIWFKTGDIGYYDEDGNIYIIERIKYFLEVKNNQLSPTIFENILYNYPEVFEAVIIYVPSHNNDKYVIAFVTKMSGIEVTEMELKQLVTKDSSNNELRNVIFLPYLPRFSNGKINRKLLYKMARNIFYEST